MPRRLALLVLATATGAAFLAAHGCGLRDSAHVTGARRCVSETGSGGMCADGRALENVLGVAATADGQSVYVAADVSDAVATFDRERATGALTQKVGAAGCVSETGTNGRCQDGRGLNAPNGLGVSADGRNLYAASIGSDAVVIFNRDSFSGAVTQKPGTAGCVSEPGRRRACRRGKALNGASDLAVSVDGKSIYVAAQLSDAVAVFDREPTTGALRQKAGTAGCISETGTSGRCQDGTALDGVLSVAVSPDGTSVYAASTNSDAVAVFDRNPATGALSQKPGTAACISETGTRGACGDGKALLSAAGVAVSPDGASVYVASQHSNAVAIFDRDHTGTLRQKPGESGCVSETGAGTCADGSALDGVIGIAVSTDGRAVYSASMRSDAVASFDRDRATGALRQRRGPAGCVSETGAGPCQDGAALDFPRDVEPSADGKTLYVASALSDAVAILPSLPRAVSPDARKGARTTSRPARRLCSRPTGRPCPARG